MRTRDAPGSDALLTRWLWVRVPRDPPLKPDAGSRLTVGIMKRTK